jgi:hypothetical protein
MQDPWHPSVQSHREVILLCTEAHALAVRLLFCLDRSMSSVFEFRQGELDCGVTLRSFSMSSAFGFRQGALETLFTTALEPKLNSCVFNY